MSDKLEFALDEAEEKIEQLLRYVKHGSRCSFIPESRLCNCGLNKILDADREKPILDGIEADWDPSEGKP